jgi:hydroxymethylglutaryl-CoA lyase
MAWNLPWEVRSQVRRVVETFPDVRTVHLHLHDARGSALLSAYEAMNALDESHTLVLDTAVGGLGGCPYSGHGRMTRMIPTEDLVDLLNERGVETGIDLAALIEAAHVAEEIVGHPLWGRVSKAGPRPRGSHLFAMDMPMIETEEQAQHFRLGPAVYDDAPTPWAEPIVSPMRSA